MFGDVVCGVSGARFEDEIARIKRELRVTVDTELDADALRELTARFRALYDSPRTRARTVPSTRFLTRGRESARWPTGA